MDAPFSQARSTIIIVIMVMVVAKLTIIILKIITIIISNNNNNNNNDRGTIRLLKLFTGNSAKITICGGAKLGTTILQRQ